MTIVYDRDFDKVLAKLPKDIQTLYSKQEGLFRINWRDPRLQVKKLKDHPFPYSFRVTRGYRVIFTLINPEMAFFATIGHRKDVYR